jgi:LacI family transcriptional regulator
MQPAECSIRKMPSRQVATSRDVARLAGVSQASVSRVLTNHPHVSEAMRQRVRDALTATGYTPNTQARAMRTHRTGTIGIVTGRITNPFYPQLLEALARAVTEQGHRMTLWHSDGGAGELAAVEAIRGLTVDGVIFTTATAESESLAQAIRNRLPIVLVNRSLEGAPCDQVASDNTLGGRLVADYLVGLGHTKLATIGGDETMSTGRERRHGFLSRLAELGIHPPEAWTHETDFTHQGGLDAMLRVFEHKETPTAVFCANDLLAFGALDAARRLGVRVPDDVWVVGYDDVDLAGWDAFRLTTVRQPIEEMGRLAVELLLRRLEEPDMPYEQRRFGCELVVRETTAGAQAHQGGVNQ